MGLFPNRSLGAFFVSSVSPWLAYVDRQYNHQFMPTVFPFRALRPTPEAAAAVAAVPYDVVTTEEARQLADGNPLSFLHVSRAEIDLPARTTGPRTRTGWRTAARALKVHRGRQRAGGGGTAG